jgi:hypothetical protein
MAKRHIDQMEAEIEQSKLDQSTYAKTNKHHKADQEFGKQKGLARAIEILSTKEDKQKEAEQLELENE